MLKKFLQEIQNLQYCVQRNWENLPESHVVGSHNDLDLFSTDEDKPKIEEAVQRYGIDCDVRSPEDDYYPREIAEKLLKNRVEMDGFYIPEAEAAFLALFYHSAVHKEGNPYERKLREMFLDMYPPVKAKDEGVGWYL